VIIDDRSDVKTQRVIIADSSQRLLEGIRGLLETVFGSVVMVADAESLMDAAEMIGADLVVVDISLGDNTWAEAVKTIKSRFPDIKVLVTSIHDEQAALQQALSAGADGFVLKRLAANDLIPAVEAILAGGTFASNPQKS